MMGFKKVLLISNLLLGSITCIAWLSPYGFAQETLVIPILGLIYPALLLVHVVFIAIWALLRSKWLGLSLFMLILSQAIHPQVFGIVNSTHTLTAEGIGIATFNTQFLFQEKYGATRDAEIVRYLDAPILCLQECNKATVDYVTGLIDFPYIDYDSSTTIAILSKYPILASGQVNKPSNPANVIKWLDLLIGKDTIRLYNAHLESNRISGEIPKDVVIVANEQVNLAAYFGILKHYVKFSNYRIIQAMEIKTHMSDCKYPVIICGDMNDSPMSRVYGVLSEDMQDTWYAGGFGFGNTHDTWVPGMRIDLIITSKDWNVLNYKRHPVDFSDHSIITTQLKLK